MLGFICSFCDAQHPLDPVLGDVVRVFLDSSCHYILVNCPNCGLVDHAFCDGDQIEEAWAMGIQIKIVKTTPEYIELEYTEFCQHEEMEEAVCNVLEEMLQRRQPELGAGDANLER